MYAKSVTDTVPAEFCALEIGDSGIAYARTYYPPNLPPVLKECAFFPYDSGNSDPLQNLSRYLFGIVNKYHIEHLPCNWVLHPKHYRLLITNTPSVPPEEQKMAVKWQIKDMVDYPVEDITIDTFSFPSFISSEQAKLYAVVAQTSFLQQTHAALEENKINLVAIDIREFAIRNLLANMSYDEKPVGFLTVEKSECLLMIVQNAQLCFVRRIPFGIETSDTAFDSNKLAEEIQKTLDYYTIELKQEVPIEFMTPPLTKLTTKLADTINKRISISIRSLPLDEIIKSQDGDILSSDLQKSCYIAIGGSLRHAGE